MRRSFCSARYWHTLLKGTLRPSAQTRTASARIFDRSRWRSAKLPNLAIAACWRSSFWTFAASLVHAVAAKTPNRGKAGPNETIDLWTGTRIGRHRTFISGSKLCYLAQGGALQSRRLSASISRNENPRQDVENQLTTGLVKLSA